MGKKPVLKKRVATLLLSFALAVGCAESAPIDKQLMRGLRFGMSPEEAKEVCATLLNVDPESKDPEAVYQTSYEAYGKKGALVLIFVDDALTVARFWFLAREPQEGWAIENEPMSEADVAEFMEGFAKGLGEVYGGQHEIVAEGYFRKSWQGPPHVEITYTPASHRVFINVTQRGN